MSYFNKTIFKKPDFIVASFILVLVCYIRITRGLDLTDEMQYYGEIKGLIDSGALFSTDLFIQQSVYILFYPLFYLYHSLFEYDGFVFFGRLVMATLSIGVFLYSYKKLLNFDVLSVVATFTALSLTFAIPFHGIFAPSYNTIAQVLWIVFIFKYIEWKPNNGFLLALIPILMMFAHPTSAVMILLLVLARLLFEHNYKTVVRFILVCSAVTLIVSPAVFYFSSLQGYLTSLSFSSGYGVGAVFFAKVKQPLTLLVVFILFGGVMLFRHKLQKIESVFPVVFLIAVLLNLLDSGNFGGGYTLSVFRRLSFLSILAYGWSLSSPASDDAGFRQLRRWFVVAILAYATTIGVTSGNGLGQATGAFMVGLPLFLAFAVGIRSSEEISGNRSFIKIVSVVLLSALFIAHWCFYPYREESWWNARNPVLSIPEYRFISTSTARANFIQRMKRELKPVVHGKRTLIIGDYPGLYFVTGAEPETCMFYMHSLTSSKSKEALLGCMADKSPEIVVDIFSDKVTVDKKPLIKTVMYDFYNNRGYNCDEKDIDFDIETRFNPEKIKYYLCK